MAQTPALIYSSGASIDHTPGSDVAAGAVVVVGTLVGIAPASIAAGTRGALLLDGVVKVPKTADTFAAGDALYWDADGNPYGGTAGSGAVSPGAETGYRIGTAVAAGGATETYALVRLTGHAGSMPRLPVAIVAAGGTAQANAAALVEGLNVVTGANDTAAVVLPPAAAGKQVIVKNTVANKILPVFPAAADGINALSANASLDMAAATSAWLIAKDGTTWYSLPLLPS